MKINYNIGNEKPMLLRFFPRRSIRPFDIVDLIVDRNGVMESFLNMQLKDHMLLYSRNENINFYLYNQSHTMIDSMI